MRYPLRQAVPLNLAVSGITIAAALLIRSRTLSLAAVGPWQTAILAISGGAVITAALGPSLARRLPPHRVEGLIIGILMAIGGLLLGEGLFPQAAMQVFPRDGGGAILSGVGMGLLVGLVSSLLGVAGGS